MSNVELIKNFHNRIFGLNYSDVLTEYLKIYIQQFGVAKYEEIDTRIKKSDTFSKLIASSMKNRTYVNEKSIIGAILTIPYFMFKDGNTQYLAGVLALERWNKEVNTFTNIQTEEDLKFVAIEMFLYIDRTKGFRV